MKMSKLIVIILCLVVSCLFLGCKKNDTIKFYRQSEVDSFIEKTKNDKNKKTSVTIDKSGVVIYKDNSIYDKTNGEARNFSNSIIGPKDLDFDFKIEFQH